MINPEVKRDLIVRPKYGDDARRINRRVRFISHLEQMGWLSDANDVTLAPTLVLQRLSARNAEYSDTQDTFMRFVAN